MRTLHPFVPMCDGGAMKMAFAHLSRFLAHLSTAQKKPGFGPAMLVGGQALGSKPSRSNLLRQASFTQALNCPGPAAMLICSSSSSSKRIFLTVLPERSNSLLVDFFSCIGIYHCYMMVAYGIYHSKLNQVKLAKPGSVCGTNRASHHKTLYEVTHHG